MKVAVLMSTYNGEKYLEEQIDSRTSSWFITACTNQPIVLLAKELLYEYWKTHNDMMDYFLSITAKVGEHINEVTGAIDSVKGLTDVCSGHVTIISNESSSKLKSSSVTCSITDSKYLNALFTLSA